LSMPLLEVEILQGSQRASLGFKERELKKNGKDRLIGKPPSQQGGKALKRNNEEKVCWFA